MTFKTNKYALNSPKFETIMSFGDGVFNGKISLRELLLSTISELNSKARPKAKAHKKKKRYSWKYNCYLWRQIISFGWF